MNNRLMLYPDSWHLYGCGFLHNSIVVECDLPYMCMYKIINLFLYTSKSLFYYYSVATQV